jgi:hypothetical protein
VEAARQDAKGIGIVQCDAHEHVIGQDADRKELEDAVFGGLDGDDVTIEAGKRFAKFRTSFPEEPPFFGVFTGIRCPAACCLAFALRTNCR